MKKYILPIIISLLSIIAILGSLYIYDNNYSSYKDALYNPNYNEVIYYKLKGLSTYYIEALNNEYLIWKRAKNRNISKSYIESIVGIKKSELNNQFCDLMESDYSEDGAIKCIETYYKDNGLYDLLDVEYDEIYKIYKHGNNNIVRQKAISILYLIEDLRHLPINSNESYEKFYEKYKSIVKEIEIELDDMHKKV